jgi:hypothetical protein
MLAKRVPNVPQAAPMPRRRNEGFDLVAQSRFGAGLIEIGGSPEAFRHISKEGKKTRKFSLEDFIVQFE